MPAAIAAATGCGLGEDVPAAFGVALPASAVAVLSLLSALFAPPCDDGEPAVARFNAFAAAAARADAPSFGASAELGCPGVLFVAVSL
jgi:hypothetical protein